MKTMPISRLRIFLPFLLLLPLAGCLLPKPTVNPTTYYLLGSGEEQAPEKLSSPAGATGEQIFIGVVRPTIPPYLDTAKLAFRSEGWEIRYLENDRWAAPPPYSTGQAIRSALAAQMPEALIRVSPFPGFFNPDLILEVTFETLEGNLMEKSASASGHWVLTRKGQFLARGRLPAKSATWDGKPENLPAAINQSLRDFTSQLVRDTLPHMNSEGNGPSGS